MSNYVTLNQVKTFERTLKDDYKSAFKFGKLNDKEKQYLTLYNLSKTGSLFEDHTNEIFNNEEKKYIKSALIKVNGVKLTKEIECKMLDKYRECMNYVSLFDKPSIFHPFKLYAYYKCNKMAENFEKKLIAKGISKEKLNEAVESNYEKFDELKNGILGVKENNTAAREVVEISNEEINDNTKDMEIITTSFKTLDMELSK